MKLRALLAGLAISMTGCTAEADSMPGYDRNSGLPFASRSEVIASNGMAATSHPLTTQIALDVLKAGGNAIDAAIAANAALGLMEPTGNGIGGDLFAIVWDAGNEELVGLNASGRAPALMTLEYFRENNLTDIPKYGPLPVSVPGAVDGWFELHGRFGSVPMAELLAPAIRYAREGFPVTEEIARLFVINENVSAITRASPRRSCRAAGCRRRARCSVTRGWRTRSRLSPRAVATHFTKAILRGVSTLT